MFQDYNITKTCCFSGHRKLVEADQFIIARFTLTAIHNAVLSGYQFFICGGATGFDMLDSYSVLYLKAVCHPNIKLLLCLPCKDQDKSYNLSQKEQYVYFVKAADELEILSEHYYNGCMQKRNKRMVDLSSRCIYYLEPHYKSGGTYHTVAYANQKGIDTIDNIYDDVINLTSIKI